MMETEILNIPELTFAEGFAPDSRVWIYIASRNLSGEETQFAENQLNAFCKTWTAHNQSLKSAAEFFQNRVLILMVDETMAGASGCSIDKSVHFLESLGQRLGVDFFDRMQFGWQVGEIVKFGDKNELAAALNSGEVLPETLMLNSVVQTKMDLEKTFWVLFSSSWHRRLV